MVIAFPSTDQSPSTISSSFSWIGMDGVAIFVYGLSSTNGIHCVKLPPPGASGQSHKRKTDNYYNCIVILFVLGIPERFELNDRSVVTKFWNLLPAGIR